MNCKRCLHPQWAHQQFDGTGSCLAVIHTKEPTRTETENSLTLEWTDDGILHCICPAFVSTGTFSHADRRR